MLLMPAGGRVFTAATAAKSKICLCEKYVCTTNTPSASAKFPRLLQSEFVPGMGDAVRERTRFSNDEKRVQGYGMSFGRGHAWAVFVPYFRMAVFMYFFFGAG